MLLAGILASFWPDDLSLVREVGLAQNMNPQQWSASESFKLKPAEATGSPRQDQTGQVGLLQRSVPSARKGYSSLLLPHLVSKSVPPRLCNLASI